MRDVKPSARTLLFALLCAASISASAEEPAVPHMGGIGDALRFPVIDHRKQPWDDLTLEQSNEISYLLVSLEAHMNAQEAALHVEQCRASSAPAADELQASLEQFESQAARFIQKGAELAKSGLSAAQLHGHPLPAEEVQRQMNETSEEIRADYNRRGQDVDALHQHCRTLGAVYLDSLIKLIYPARTDPKYMW